MKNIFQTGLVLMLLNTISFSNTTNAQSSNAEGRVYIKLEIMGLACPYCAYGMEKELKKVTGVEGVDIELKKGLAYISTPKAQKPSKENLEKIIVDAGFTAGTIEFSDKPFEREKTKKKKK